MSKYRGRVNKHRSAKSFRRNTMRTKEVNLRGAPMRGGIRFVMPCYHPLTAYRSAQGDVVFC